MKDPAVLLYIDVWKSATTEMDAITRAYYMDLILHQYDKGSLPNKIEELANICRVRFSEFEKFKQVFEQVLKHKFKQNDEGRLENDFASEIIRKRNRFIKKRSDAGRLSYILKYFKANFKVTKKLEVFIKQNMNLDFDIKNKQMLKQVFEQMNELYINVDVDIDVIINVDEKKKFIPPALDEWINYFKEKGYKTDVAQRSWDYYNIADWYDSKGNKVKNWKQKAISVWFKDENKLPGDQNEWVDKALHKIRNK